MVYSKLITLFLIVSAILLFEDVGICQPENIKTEIVKELNKIRQSGCKCGEEQMPPAGTLIWSEKLEQAALRHVNDMFDHDHFDHTGTDGSDLGDRVDDTGYKWAMLGENISCGYTTVEQVVQGWLDSEWHCRNLMNPVFREVGAAKKGQYWALDLGRSKTIWEVSDSE